MRLQSHTDNKGEKMSSIKELLDGVEVEWKALGQALVRTKGTKITATKMKEINKIMHL